MTFEDLLREAAAKGLTHFTIWPTPSEDRKTVYWTARATPSTQHSYVQSHGTDPVDVALAVLKSLPKAPKREQKKITATVKEPPAIETPAGEMDEWLPKT